MRKILLMLTMLAAQVASATSLPALTTLSEQSGFTRTGRYAEVIALCGAFAKRYPQAVKCQDFGVTPEGRPMKVLVASQSGALTPERARQMKLPVVLVQGGIHSGEIDGKDAGFWALRDLLEGKVLPGALKQQVLLFVPVFNIDGHERFGKWNRPNQRGPEEMGWRTTAQNYNLNREYVKADAPEMQAMLRLVRAWDPLATIDLHVTDGAKFEHDIGIIVQPSNVGDEAMQKVGTAFRDETVVFLARNGSLPLPFYPAFIEDDNPASGIREGVPPPRLSHGYFWLKNRMGMLAETHSWKDYPARVKATRNVILSVLEQMAQHGQAWLKTAAEADARAAQLAGTPVVLAYKVTDESREIEFRGYAYTRTPSDISGALMTRYDESKPEIWKLKFRDKVTPQLTITAPGAGYLVPPAHAALVKRALHLHGVEYRVLKAAQQGGMEAFRATKTTFTPRPVEQRQRMTLEGAWKTEPRSVAAGALFVPIAQANARLAMSILEPTAPDSLASWGSFNIFFERREYMEQYVAEDVAREMLAKDPALDAAFAKRIADDAEFAKSPTARLDFFYQRHSSWDDHFNLYPVFRVNQTPR
ncbi:MAG: zinc carboxypeptidase family protein [Deltaproteobacteria bacterium]|nr:zinc carboxypeptidase family protein [Deltaproteobacteria bacterium]MBS1236566.1 zinc carboxypeptidase family protein [Pseudomonadota bacterium]